MNTSLSLPNGWNAESRNMWESSSNIWIQVYLPPIAEVLRTQHATLFFNNLRSHNWWVRHVAETWKVWPASRIIPSGYEPLSIHPCKASLSTQWTFDKLKQDNTNNNNNNNERVMTGHCTPLLSWINNIYSHLQVNWTMASSKHRFIYGTTSHYLLVFFMAWWECKHNRMAFPITSVM